MARINVSGPIKPSDTEYPIPIMVGLPIMKDGKVIGRITKVDTDNNTFYGTVDEEVELIFPDMCSLEIAGGKED